MDKTYSLVPSKVFLKDIVAVPADLKLIVEKALSLLKKDLYSGRNIKKLSSVKIGIWRLRIGNWRVRYDVIGREIRLHVIRQRKEVYR